MATELKTIVNQRNPEYEMLIDSFTVWRAAITAQLDAGFEGSPQDVKFARVNRNARSLDEAPANFLYRFTFESARNYFDRLLLSHDFGDSGRVVASFVGHLLRAKITKVFDFGEEVNKKFVSNIDNKGSDLNVFLIKVASELIGMGRVWVVTDAPQAIENQPQGPPLSFIVKREDMLDWAEDQDGLMFVKYQSVRHSFEGLQRTKVDQIITITKDEFILIEKIKGNWKEVDRFNHALGVVPVQTAKMGADGRPVIEVVAKIQIDLMNIVSELRHAIRSQALSILTVPQGTKIDDLTTSTYLEIPASAYSPQWLAYPAGSLEAHFKYTDFIINRIFELSNLRNEKNNRAAQSGISQAWDFLDTETVLIVAAEAIEEIMKNVMDDWSRFTDTNNENTCEIEKRFDFQALQNQLENAMRALSLGLGKLAETMIRKKVRDSMVVMSPDQKDKSDLEIETINDLDESVILDQPLNDEEA